MNISIKNMVAVMLGLVCVSGVSSQSKAQTPDQPRDQGRMIEYENPYYESIQDSIREFNEVEESPKLRFKMDFSNVELPRSTKEFTTLWHNEPLSQGNAGTCWCFAATSTLEADCFRLTGQEFKFSELHTAYWEYVEKARRFVHERGDSHFSEGSQGNAVLRIWKQYGCVPADAYSGKLEGQTHHDHSKMFEEMETYLMSLQQSNAWNERAAIETIRSIMDHYIGCPPETITYDGREMTPLEFLHNEVKVDPDEYVDFLSFMSSPYGERAEYEVEDNWWHGDHYNNIPLDDFMDAIKNSVENGYTVCLGGDVSESGYFPMKDVAMVPTYDIPSAYIDENARLFRFLNETTTDDHAIHIVGSKQAEDGVTWFLIKDSGSGARNGRNKGYYFYHEDYIKLKMTTFMVHQSAVEEYLR
jgi:bleomycin hydrolase